MNKEEFESKESILVAIGRLAIKINSKQLMKAVEVNYNKLQMTYEKDS